MYNAIYTYPHRTTMNICIRFATRAAPRGTTLGDAGIARTANAVSIEVQSLVLFFFLRFLHCPLRSITYCVVKPFLDILDIKDFFFFYRFQAFTIGCRNEKQYF